MASTAKKRMTFILILVEEPKGLNINWFKYGTYGSKKRRFEFGDSAAFTER